MIKATERLTFVINNCSVLVFPIMELSLCLASLRYHQSNLKREIILAKY